MILRVGFQTFEFHEGREIHFGSHQHAAAFLKHLGLPDPALMVRLRKLLASHSADADVARLTDDQVVERLSAMLYSGRISVLRREQQSSSGTPTPSTAPAAPAFPLSERAQAATTTTTAAPPVADPATFAPNTAAAAQAAALVAAAASGTPFCQECSKS